MKTVKALKGHCRTLYSTLRQGGNWTVLELCEELDFPIKNKPTDLYYTEKIRILISQLRKKFRDNEMNPESRWIFINDERPEELLWVGSDISGYTLRKSIRARAFESRIRAAQLTSGALNGELVFNDFKKLAPKAFYKFQIELKPQLLRIGRLLK